jgi:hypothetical protein
MSVWLTMLKKDIRILKNQCVAFLGIVVIVTAAVLTANSFGILDARTTLIVAVVLTCTPLCAFPAQLFRGINKEVKEASALWLYTPKSGWAMLGSKSIASLIGSLLYFVVCFFLVLALFHSVNIAHALPPLHYQTQTHSGDSGFTLSTQNGTSLVNVSPAHISILVAQIPRIEFYVMMLFLCCGLYLGMWITLIYMSVCAVKNRFKKFTWLVGLGVVLIATWGLGALGNTALYEQLFGWGRVSVLNLFPSDVRTLLPGHVSATIVTGHFAFNAIIVVLLFYVTGLIIDRYLEV